MDARKSVLWDEMLFEVLTIQEVAYMWEMNATSVRRAIDSARKPLVARKPFDCPGSTWLVSYRSCVRRWGEPKHLPT